jgi:tight adherence protein C
MDDPEKRDRLMSDPFVMAAIAGSLGAALACLAALLISREAAHRDLMRRAQRLIRGDAPENTGPARTAGSVLLGSIGRLGEALRGTIFFSRRDVEIIERATQSAGLDGRRLGAAVIGSKAILLMLCPVVAYAISGMLGCGLRGQLVFVLAAALLGSIAPNWLLASVQRSYTSGLRRGLPDAMDLMVVCTEAGLGLESALERVSVELRASAPGVAMEFSLLVQDLRLTVDRRAALQKFGERSGVEGFQRLSATLSQTLKYGTPIGQALRSLAAEMRQERLIRIEEKAARLPALLSLALVAFILPCLFIVLAGPAAMRVLDAVAGH